MVFKKIVMSLKKLTKAVILLRQKIFSYFLKKNNNLNNKEEIGGFFGLQLLDELIKNLSGY